MSSATVCPVHFQITSGEPKRSAFYLMYQVITPAIINNWILD
jgi:hypothetical protein